MNGECTYRLSSNVAFTRGGHRHNRTRSTVTSCSLVSLLCPLHTARLGETVEFRRVERCEWSRDKLHPKGSWSGSRDPLSKKILGPLSDLWNG